MKKISILLLSLSSFAYADMTTFRSKLSGLSIGLGVGDAHYSTRVDSHYTYTNLYGGGLANGYQHIASFGLGKSDISRGVLSLNLAYERPFMQDRLKRFNWGLMGSYDAGIIHSDTISLSGLTIPDPSLNNVYPDLLEVFTSFGASASLTQKHHWSIGPSIGYRYNDKFTLFGKVAYHQICGNLTMTTTTPDNRYTVGAPLSSGHSFPGIGFAIGGTYGPKTGWYAQPQAEYVFYNTESASAPRLTQSSYEVTYVSSDSFKLKSYSGKFTVGYRL
ncbi:MAG: hypothetical protein V4490_05050 [Pseudomonadota bacterium]